MRRALILAALLAGAARAWCLPQPIFHASYDAGLDADRADGDPAARPAGEPQLVPGRKGTALRVGKDIGQVNYAAAGNFNLQRGSIEMWVRAVDWTHDHPSFCTLFGANGFHVYKYFKGSQILFYMITEGAPHGSAASQDISDWDPARWYHICVVWDGGDMAIYRDGALGKRTTGTLPTVIDETFHVGTGPEGFGADARTDLDEVYIYDRPLTDAEVRAVYLRLGLADAAVYLPPHLGVPQIDLAPGPEANHPSWLWAAGPGGFADPATGRLAAVQPEVLALSDGHDLHLRWWLPGTGVQPSLDLYLPDREGKVARISVAADGALTGAAIEGLRASTSLEGGRWTGWLALPLVVPERMPDAAGLLLPGGVVDRAGRITGTARLNLVLHPDPGSSLLWAHALDLTDPETLGTVEVLSRTPGAALLPLQWGEERVRVGVRLQGYESWRPSHLTAELRTMAGTDARISQPIPAIVGAHQREVWLELPLGNPDAVALDLSLVAHEKDGDRTALRATLPDSFLPPLAAELTYYRFDEELLIALRPNRDELLRGHHGTVSITGEGAPLTLDLPRTAEGTFAATADGSALAPGMYRLAGAVVDADGNTLATVHRDWECEPDGWEWLRAQGVVEGVLPPWTPVEVQGTVARCWGREFELSRGLPSSIISQGEELLAGPVRLSLGEGWHGPAAPGQGPATLSRDGEVAVEVRAASLEGSIPAELRGRLEYDGLLRYQITITPREPMRAAEFALVIPLKSRFATLLNYTPLDSDQPLVYEGEGSLAHGLPDKDGVLWSAGFVPFVWIGNEDVGLAWMMEDDRAFELAEGEPAVSIVRSGETSDLIVSFGGTQEKPRTLAGPVTIDFALQPAPVRPLPEDWRSWRWLSQTWDFDPVEGSDPVHRWRNISVYWWTLYGDLIGAPASFPWSAMGDYARYLDLKGGDLLPYMESGSVPTRSPEGARYADRWARMPRVTADQMVKCCYRSDFSEYVVWYCERLLAQGAPGVYIDLAGIRGCTNEAHGCGYRRGDEVRPSFPIFAARRCYQRLRGLFVQRGLDPLIVTSSRWKWPHYFYADSACSGEQFYHPINTDQKPYHEIAPLDHWRAEFLSPQFGNVSVFLPAWRDAAVYARPDETQQMLALTLQHEVEVWPIWCAAGEVSRTWQAKSRFGMTPDTVFHPYWREQRLVTTDAPDTLIGVYTKPGRALAIVTNASDADRDISLRADLGALGLEAGVECLDATSGDALTLEAGRVTVSVPARRFRMVLLR